MSDEAHMIFKGETSAEVPECVLEVSTARNNELCIGETVIDGGKSRDEQVETLFRRQPADGKKMRAGSSPHAYRAFDSRTNAFGVNRVWQHECSRRRDAEIKAKLVRHGAGLTNDAVGLLIGDAIEESGQSGGAQSRQHC